MKQLQAVSQRTGVVYAHVNGVYVLEKKNLDQAFLNNYTTM